MKRYFRLAPILLLLIGVSCSIAKPTATIVVNPPSAQPIESTLTSNPLPTATLTAIPTLTPVPTATASPSILAEIGPDYPGEVSEPILSSRGQLAVIVHGVLFLEVEPTLGHYQEIDRLVSRAVWSPDGSKLIYHQYPADDPNANKNDFRIWLADERKVEPLSKFVGSFSQPLTVRSVWTSNDKLFFINLHDSEVSLADLTRHTFRPLLRMMSDAWVYPINSNLFLFQAHCGSPCESLEGYNYTGRRQWSLPWRTAGSFAISPDNKFLIITGYSFDSNIQTATVDEVNLLTGQVNPIWDSGIPPEEKYFPLFHSPSISPDGTLVGFYFGDSDTSFELSTLHVIDRAGNSQAQIDNAQLLDWCPTGGLTLWQKLSEDQTRVAFLSTDDGTLQTITNLDTTMVTQGRWSPDGKYFVFDTFGTASTPALYLWERDTQQLQQIASANGEMHFTNITWLPDSKRFYYGEYGSYPGFPESIWSYEVATAQTDLLAASE